MTRIRSFRRKCYNCSFKIIFRTKDYYSKTILQDIKCIRSLVTNNNIVYSTFTYEVINFPNVIFIINHVKKYVYSLQNFDIETL